MTQSSWHGYLRFGTQRRVLPEAVTHAEPVSMAQNIHTLIIPSHHGGSYQSNPLTPNIP
jgi:hypothetical protein